VEFNLSDLPTNTVHISDFRGEDGGTEELNPVSMVGTVFTDHLGLRTPGVYRIPCECGRVCIGQTGRSVDIRLKELQRHIRLEHSVNSAVAEHSSILKAF
jgi:hypothetical protein